MKKILYLLSAFLLITCTLKAELSFPSNGGGGVASTTYNDDVPLYLGTSNNAAFLWNTNGANDSFLHLKFVESDGASLPLLILSDASLTASSVFDDLQTPGLVIVNDGGTAYARYKSSGVAASSGWEIEGELSYLLQTVTVADNGNGGTAASGTITPTQSVIHVTCNDANGCNMTMSETSAIADQVVTIVNISANTVNMADTSGVSEIADAFAMGQYDSIDLIYIVDRWVEKNRSNN